VKTGCGAFAFQESPTMASCPSLRGLGQVSRCMRS
jgi:hypothetical protein